MAGNETTFTRRELYERVANYIEGGYERYPAIQRGPQLRHRHDVIAERYGHLIPG
jgi:hypothetical protein